MAVDRNAALKAVQTETGAILVTPLPGLTSLKPGSATRPFPGISADVVNEKGESVACGGGYLVLKRPWPSMLRTIYGDDERYQQQSFSRFGPSTVVGKAHEIKGQAITAFVTLKDGLSASPPRVDALKEHVVTKVGAIARPDDIIFTADLPKARSGKIMRRLLRDIADGKTLGATTMLADPAAVARLKEKYEEQEAGA